MTFRYAVTKRMYTVPPLVVVLPSMQRNRSPPTAEEYETRTSQGDKFKDLAHESEADENSRVQEAAGEDAEAAEGKCYAEEKRLIERNTRPIGSIYYGPPCNPCHRHSGRIAIGALPGPGWARVG